MSTPIMFLGNGQNDEVILVSDQNDIREGRTIVLEKRKPMLTGKLSAADLNPPSGYRGGLVSIDVQCSDGVAVIRWTYRTQYSAGRQNRDGGGEREQEIYELDGSTSQEPITSHPKYSQLVSQYASGERDGEPVWFEKDPDGASQTTGLSSGGNAVSKISPLYGVKDFLMANAVYRRTKYYSDRGSIPNTLVSKIGKIDEPAGLSEGAPVGRFLRVGAEMRQMGDSFQVTEQWMASQSDKPEGLWKSELYGS
jgi:hypothetical protein